MKRYQEWLARLYSTHLRGGVKLGLDITCALHKELGAPSLRYPSLHIAGTNGKGSVAHKVARSLSFAGYRIGLFSSPHIASFRERIQIDGELISCSAVVEGLDRIAAAQQKLGCEATFFEMTTLLALQEFARCEVDFAVIEVGLGGRLDATNIIRPHLSCITSIAFDHTEILGRDLVSIAEEKAGIMKPEVPLVVGDSVPLEVIERKSHELCVPIHRVASSDSTELASCCLEQLQVLLPHVVQQDVLHSSPPCRYQWHQNRGVELVLDVAHNPPALQRLMARLESEYPNRPLHVVASLAATKEVTGCMSALLRGKSCIALWAGPRCMTPEQMVGATCCGGVEEAMEKACQLARADGGIVVVTGTFLLMAPVLNWLGVKMEVDPVIIREFCAPKPI